MVDKVDAMIFAGLYEVKWWPQLTKPYLEAGIPCFINRPFALSMKDALEMVNTAKRHNTPILCTDAHEDMKESIIAAEKIKQLLKEKKNILGAEATTDARDYPGHGVHGLYMLLPVLGLDVEQVSLQAPGWWGKPLPRFPNSMEWGLLTLQYRGISIPGAGSQKKPFLGTVKILEGNYGSRATLRLFFNGGWQDFDHHRINARENLINQRYHLQSKTVFNMQRMFETRKMPWSYDYILEKTRIFLAGFKSHIDHNGMMIRLNDPASRSFLW